jgi:hypothetical protein
MSRLRKTHNRLISFFGLITISIFGIISILGTGGGGGDGGGVTPVTYTGETAQAVITSDNALLFGELAFLGVSASGTVEPIGIIQSTPLAENRNASIISIARVLHTVIKNIEVTSAINTLPIGWIETQPPISGDCSSGTASGSIDIDETTQMFSGNLVFDNFCDSGITMNGSIGIVGTCSGITFDPNTQTCDISDYILSFNTFNVSGYGVSQTLKGDMHYGYSVITPNVYNTVLFLLIRDDNTNTTYKFDNYAFTVTNNSGYDYVEITTGSVPRVYHPKYGFVIVSIPTPVQFDAGMLDTSPLTGVVLLTGANGTAGGPTTATFTFIDSDNFTLEVDTNGDGAPDVILNCTWSTGICA